MRGRALAALAVALAGCGDDSGTPGEGDDRGAGVGALGGALASRRSRARAWQACAGRPGLGRRRDPPRARRGDPPLPRARLRLRAPGPSSAWTAKRWRRARARPSRPASATSTARTTTARWCGRSAWPPPTRRHCRAPGECSRASRSRASPPGPMPASSRSRCRRAAVGPPSTATPVPSSSTSSPGEIDYQNAMIGTKRLGPGGAEAIPPETAVQKRNPFSEPAVFLSWFLVDPDRPSRRRRASERRRARRHRQVACAGPLEDPALPTLHPRAGRRAGRGGAARHPGRGGCLPRSAPACWPSTASPAPGCLRGSSWFEQRGDGLGERLGHALDAAGGPALVVGMDTPQLTPACSRTPRLPWR